MPRTVAIVQARTRSTRLPAKIFLDLGGEPALLRCLERTARIRGVDEVWVATTTSPEDELVVDLASKHGFRSHRGSVEDVLGRYYDTAVAARADVVLRITSDCPLIDPPSSSAVLDALGPEAGTAVDYASNTFERKMPRGHDTEVFSFAALERAHREARTAEQREHVTPFIRTSPQFKTRSVTSPGPDRSSERWTLDTLEDYHFLARLFLRLGERAAHASYEEILAVLDAEPSLRTINADVAQKPSPG